MIKKEDWHEHYKKQNKKDEQEIKVKEEEKKKIAGIGGWLVVPAVALVLSLIAHIPSLFSPISVTRNLLPELTGNFMFGIFCFINFAMAVFAVTTTFFFFGKNRIAIRFFILFMLATILIDFIFAFFLPHVLNQVVVQEAVNRSILLFIPRLILIFYFINSKRVKNTFIN